MIWFIFWRYFFFILRCKKLRKSSKIIFCEENSNSSGYILQKELCIKILYKCFLINFICVYMKGFLTCLFTAEPKKRMIICFLFSKLIAFYVYLENVDWWETPPQNFLQALPFSWARLALKHKTDRIDTILFWEKCITL